MSGTTWRATTLPPSFWTKAWPSSRAVVTLERPLAGMSTWRIRWGSSPRSTATSQVTVWTMRSSMGFRSMISLASSSSSIPSGSPSCISWGMPAGFCRARRRSRLCSQTLGLRRLER